MTKTRDKPKDLTAPVAEKDLGRPLDATDHKERAKDRSEAQIKDSAGNPVDALSAKVGGGQVQADFDRLAISGTSPASGGPPDDSHTVAAVTQVPAANLETFEEDKK